MPSTPVPRTIFDNVCHELKTAYKQINYLQNYRSASIPIYDMDDLPDDLPDGLLFFALDTEQFVFIVDGSMYTAETEETVLPEP